MFALILDLDGNEIVAAAADRERVGKIGRLKIGNEKDNRASSDNLVQIIERECCICSATVSMFTSPAKGRLKKW